MSNKNDNKNIPKSKTPPHLAKIEFIVDKNENCYIKTSLSASGKKHQNVENIFGAMIFAICSGKFEESILSNISESIGESFAIKVDQLIEEFTEKLERVWENEPIIRPERVFTNPPNEKENLND